MSARWIAAAAFLALAALPGGDAAAQAPEEGPRPERAVEPEESERIELAREHFHKGLELTEAGRLEEALAEFQKAYDLSPSYRILYNIGQVSRHIGDAARSLRAFERYLADGAGEIEEARRAEVEGEIAALRPLVGKVRVQIDTAGAAVLLDGMKLGEAPLPEPLYVRPGKHRLQAELGKRIAVETIEVAGGQAIDVALALGSARPRPRPPVPPRPKPPVAAGGRRPLWIGWAATGALAAGAGVTGVLALVSAGQLGDARYAGPDRRPAADSEVRALGEQVDALAVATDVLAAAAVVSLGVTLVLTFSDGGRQAGARAAVSFGGGPGGVQVRGAF
jgi:hypothetical protein